MRYAILLLLFISCKKSDYKPDHDQVECSLCIGVVEHWSDTTVTKFQVSPNDTTTSNKCEQALKDFKTWKTNYYIKYCNNNGELLHWDYYRFYVKY